ncbi:type II toxin-antitoxin system RelE/ParE family toxin [Halorussus salilacus]|uniref:type II toxin-antitoxin system RelE family toxin n=1 Tax=Halorussus salilacus TaxID=2953750 RepID=UPI00209E20ED|nr:type II toxin-antitoxin system RelE/ParE family toxin [Halorussus salilacus]USZ67187.1 type II toxin-antitoxin system RelE/ParE family toxin [Halorussus salilacus]
MSYEVLLSEEAEGFFTDLDEKSQRICAETLGHLEENPYPDRGQGDKKKLKAQDEEIYRIHVGRTYTAFYVVLEDEGEVRVTDLMTIEEAHKEYGR